MTAAETTEDRTGTIPTNLRLLLVLEEVAKAGIPVTPTDVNAEIGLPKATIHRLFATLEAEGFLQREMDGRSYTIAERLKRMSANVLSSAHIRTARYAVLNALAEEIGETCNISIPDSDAMIYLERVETKWPLRIQLPVGTQVPFYCTASGKMYLSTLSDVELDCYLDAAHLEARTRRTITDRAKLRKALQDTRKRGYSQDDEEFMEGMIALAVPVSDDRSRLLATLSFHAPTQRLTLKGALAHLGPLRAAADKLSRLAA
ncbi:IclR family transcriptional regulator [Kaustia mangrovi]|uniref:IclR family transcriptional regulator n=1 Tax=Kaustia mangrovi TaxID=2593653 RepID=A0A7S8C1A4_9HYPH|nr:IclR family transcriptional regulator [Kaustia mangrovi]QPC41526.1 IclR family transcriptional regulator [Kaustia mangrovi]